jgi:hypothetical protein
MTFGTPGDDTPRDEPGQGRREGAADASSDDTFDAFDAFGSFGSMDEPFDEDAAWRSIVEHYGDRAEVEDEPPAAAPDSADSAPRAPAVLDRSYLDAQQARAEAEPPAWSDEGHFVPPEPPPVPRGTPARRLAWLGLFGAPLAMLAAVIFGWVFPSWLVLLLVVGFIGGFVFLVATMPRDRDDWSGDDGAVV